jgi:DNA-binding LacI/PurR family transcriptional regulator
LLVSHLLDNGLRRILMMTRDRMFQGDHIAVDSVRDTMTEANLPLNALTIRCMPSDHEAIKAATAQWLEGSKEPVGIVCRSLPMAKGVAAAAESLGRKVGRDVVIVLADLYRKGSEPAPGWPYLKSLLTPEQIGQHIGRMLAQQARGQVADPDHEIIPVRLEL